VPSTVAQQLNSNAKVTRAWKAERRNAVMGIVSLTVLGTWHFSNISRMKNMMNITADAMVGIKGGRIWN
jgi:hypothetical protein